ncbi:MAG: lytic murein transglycosylase [Deltaproteobacteria bacterium]|nr:lytic murein transglycosylase [Deltaproteobacteria bacterium]
MLLFVAFYADCVGAAAIGAQLSESDREYLVQSCSGAGFDAVYLEQVFADSRVRFIPGLVRSNIVNKEYAASYKRFLKPVAIGMAKRFARKWRTRLDNVGKAAGVDPEVVVAILLVETSLGQYLGSEPVTSIFASLVLENHGERRKAFGRRLEGSPDRDRMLQRLEAKASWARKELRALLAMHQQRNIDIFSLKGSYAGAFGIPQFLPSSYLQWGADGDRSNSVDLFYVPDAIVSVGSYLKAHGWQPGLDHEANRKAIWQYNHSRVYVDTVLAVAKRLRDVTADQVADSSSPRHTSGSQSCIN